MKQLFVIGLFFLLIGCQNVKTTSSIEKIKDTKTKETIPLVNSNGHTEVEHLYDSMDRGNYEYVGTLVVDSAYYNKNNFKRGEVVYYITPKTGRKNIARMVGLPGEKIEIKKGKVYINDKKLDAFYAKTMNNGIADLNTYKKKLNKSGTNIINEKSWKAYFNRNLKPVLIKEDQVFVLADNSWRAWDSFVVGPLPQENVIGKVLGIRLIDKEYVKTNAKLGLTQKEITEQFGHNYQVGTDTGVDIWMYDTTKKGFTYNRSLESIAFDEIKNDNVISQLFIYFRENKTFMYSYFYKGENGEVWEYAIKPNHEQQDIQVSN
jgi:signal peptidase I